MKKLTLSFIIVGAILFFIPTGCSKKSAAKPDVTPPIDTTTKTIPPKILDTTTAAGGNGAGSASNQFNDPSGLAMDTSGNIYVSDYLNCRIQKWAPGADTGITVAGGNGNGNTAKQLSYPRGIYLDGAGNIYIADAGNYRVQKWAPGVDSGTTVAGGNGNGSAANQFASSIADVCLDASGNLYVDDPNNNRVQKFPPGSTKSTAGTTAAGGNGIGTALNQLGSPYGLFVDGSNNLYVSEADNSNILRFPQGSTSATYGVIVAGGNGPGPAQNQFQIPVGIAIDGSGNIYVADDGNECVQKWVPGATTGITVAGIRGSGGPDYNELSAPQFIVLDAGANNLYICDQINNRVQKYQLK
jgi:sugar lactone lactonase YvrE